MFTHIQLLGSRDAGKGAEAVEALAKEGLAAELVVCDITSPEGADNIKRVVESTNGGVLDIVRGWVHVHCSEAAPILLLFFQGSSSAVQVVHRRAGCLLHML